MKRNESILFHLSVGVVANVLAFYMTRWLGNREIGAPSVSLALQVVVWAAALAVTVWCIDWLIRRGDLWLSNRYFRRAQPHRLSFRARDFRLTAQLFAMYSSDNPEHLRDFYNFEYERFQRDYDRLVKELKDSYNIILPDYSDPKGAAKALAKGVDALGEIHKEQEAKRLLRFLPSNLTIKTRR